MHTCAKTIDFPVVTETVFGCCFAHSIVLSGRCCQLPLEYFLTWLFAARHYWLFLLIRRAREANFRIWPVARTSIATKKPSPHPLRIVVSVSPVAQRLHYRQKSEVYLHSGGSSAFFEKPLITQWTSVLITTTQFWYSSCWLRRISLIVSEPTRPLRQFFF